MHGLCDSLAARVWHSDLGSGCLYRAIVNGYLIIVRRQHATPVCIPWPELSFFHDRISFGIIRFCNYWKRTSFHSSAAIVKNIDTLASRGSQYCLGDGVPLTRVGCKAGIGRADLIAGIGEDRFSLPALQESCANRISYSARIISQVSVLNLSIPVWYSIAGQVWIRQLRAFVWQVHVKTQTPVTRVFTTMGALTPL
jgi:hypothetical protein